MKFYETNWFLWLTLILFAPLGIFVLWKFHSEETTRLKAILTIIFLVLFIGVIAFSVHAVKNDKPKDIKDKPVKETTEEEIEDDSKEEVGSLVFTFSPNTVSLTVEDGMTIIVSNVDEKDEIQWIVDDPAIAYVESSVGNSCRLIGMAEGETSLKAQSSTGHGEIQVSVKAKPGQKEAAVEKKIREALDEDTLYMGSNFCYDLDVSKDLSAITLIFWFEGFSAEYVDKHAGDNFTIKALKQKGVDYTKMIQKYIESADKKAEDTEVTVIYLNGTQGDSYHNNDVDCDVTNDEIFSLKNGE